MGVQQETMARRHEHGGLWPGAAVATVTGLDVDPGDVFAVIWNESDSMREVVDVLRHFELWPEPVTTPAVVRAWASYLSEQGVELKKMNAHGQ
jgi:hypothetical protein